MGCCASAEPPPQRTAPPAPPAVGVTPPTAKPTGGPVYCTTPATSAPDRLGTNMAQFRSTGLVAEHYFGVRSAQGVPHAQP
eukprot:3568401-Prymnesium_polylepis.2